MTQTTPTTPASQADEGAVARFFRATEIDTRLLGMVGALVLIWIGFHLYGALFKTGGQFLTPRNLWNLSVQTASIGIMATGMVLVIVTRNIDLSVGSILGFCAIAMGELQVNVLPQYLGLGHPLIWIIAVLAGLTIGALIGAFHGFLIAYGRIPSFIVTLGGLLVWRGAAFLVARGETISPIDSTFQLLGGGPYGSIGATGNARRGVLGFGKDAGVVGESPKVAMQAFGGEVGVDAFASDTDGVAIRGDVRDGGHNAVAGRFLGGGPNHAFALATEGPITFGTSAGIVTIPAGETNANVTGVYCPAGSKIFATLQTSPGVTSTVAVQLCFRINDTSFEVLLTGQATDAVTVAWLVVL